MIEYEKLNGGIRIEKRAKETLAAPGITQQQTDAINTLATLTMLSYISGSVSMLDRFGKEFVDLSNSIINTNH